MLSRLWARWKVIARRIGDVQSQTHALCLLFRHSRPFWPGGQNAVRSAATQTTGHFPLAADSNARRPPLGTMRGGSSNAYPRDFLFFP